jgi:hypothetical protein
MGGESRRAKVRTKLAVVSENTYSLRQQKTVVLAFEKNPEKTIVLGW